MTEEKSSMNNDEDTHENLKLKRQRPQSIQASKKNKAMIKEENVLENIDNKADVEKTISNIESCTVQ